MNGFQFGGMHCPGCFIDKSKALCALLDQGHGGAELLGTRPHRPGHIQPCTVAGPQGGRALSRCSSARQWRHPNTPAKPKDEGEAGGPRRNSQVNGDSEIFFLRVVSGRPRWEQNAGDASCKRRDARTWRPITAALCISRLAKISGDGKLLLARELELRLGMNERFRVGP
jgi:hypothetical protein